MSRSIMKSMFETHMHGHREPPGWGLGGNRMTIAFAVLLLALICILALFLLGV